MCSLRDQEKGEKPDCFVQTKGFDGEKNYQENQAPMDKEVWLKYSATGSGRDDDKETELETELSSKVKDKVCKLTKVPGEVNTWILTVGNIKQIIPGELKISDDTKLIVRGNLVFLITQDRRKYRCHINDNRIQFSEINKDASLGDDPTGLEKQSSDNFGKELASVLTKNGLEGEHTVGEFKNTIDKPKATSSDCTERMHTADLRKFSLETDNYVVDNMITVNSEGEPVHDQYTAENLHCTNSDQGSEDWEETKKTQYDNVQLHAGMDICSTENDFARNRCVKVDEVENGQEAAKKSTQLRNKNNDYSSKIKDSVDSMPSVSLDQCIREFEDAAAEVAPRRNEKLESVKNNDTSGTNPVSFFSRSDRQHTKSEPSDKTEELLKQQNEQAAVRTSVLVSQDCSAETNTSKDLTEKAEFEVTSITARIMKEDETKQQLRQKFPDAVITSILRENGVNFCKVEGTNICVCYEAKEFILGLAGHFGHMEIGFKDVSHLDKLNNKERFLQSLMANISDETTDLMYDVDGKRSKILIIAETQSLAGTIAGKVRKAFLSDETVAPSNVDFARYFDIIQKDVLETVKNKIEIACDKDARKIKIAGLKTEVKCTAEKLKVVTEKVVLDRANVYECIIEAVKQEAGDLVEIVPMPSSHKQGFTIAGPNTYVRDIIKYVHELEEGLISHIIHISSQAELEFLENNAGRTFLNTISNGNGVHIGVQKTTEKEDSNKNAREKEWILPDGHQIIFTSKGLDSIPADFKVSIEGHTTGSRGHEEGRYFLHVPMRNGNGKDKHNFYDAVDRMIISAEEKGCVKISILLQEGGGWGFKSVVKNVIYPIKKHLTSSKLVPSTWTFCVPDSERYEEALDIIDYYLSDNQAERNQALDDLSFRKEWQTKVLEIIGLQDKVQEAKREIQDKLVEIKAISQAKMVEHRDIKAGTAVELHSKQETTEKASGHSHGVDEGVDEAGIKPVKVSPMMPDSPNGDLRKSAKSNTLPEYIKQMKLSADGNEREGTNWNPSLLLTDAEEDLCLEVELPAGSHGQNYSTVFKDMFQPPFPVRPPKLVYPFESKTKALLVCQRKEDAVMLSEFTEGNYLYKRLKPQCLQKSRITLSEIYCQTLKDRDLFDKCKYRLKELGCIEDSGLQDKPCLVIAAYSLAQTDIINNFLKTLEDPAHGSKSCTNVKHQPDEPGKSMTSKQDYNKVYYERGVSQTAWTVLNICLRKDITDLKSQNINISMNDNTVMIDGNIDEVGIAKFITAVQNLKDHQMEEIKPTKSESSNEYQKWCSEIERTVGTKCCVFDEKKIMFIAFGKTYDDIHKVKHQLGLKQGVIKQTGRRRNRHFDAAARPNNPESESDQSVAGKQESNLFPTKLIREFNWKEDAREISRFETDEGIEVNVYIANILKLPVDCIVNAANDTLQHGGGVALVIEKGAGWKLKQESEDIVKNKGKIPVGMACTTTAGDLPYECVIHTVGPCWSDFSPYRPVDVQDCERKLEAAIISSFLEAEKKSLNSIALPAISSAIFGVPEKMCAVQYAKAVIKYSAKIADRKNCLKEIHFIDKNPNIVRLIQKTFKTMITEKSHTDYNITDYVMSGVSTVYKQWEERKDRKHGRSLNTSKSRKEEHTLFWIESNEGFEIYSENQNQQVQLIVGDILNVRRVVAIACTDDEHGRGRGGIAKALLDKAGMYPYRYEKQVEFRDKKTVGDVVVSTGEGTGFRYVFHVIISGLYSNRNQKEIIQEAYKNVMVEASRRHIQSVVLPIFGTGAQKLVTFEESARAFISSFRDFCSLNSWKNSILTLQLISRTDSEKDKVAVILRNFINSDGVEEDKSESTTGSRSMEFSQNDQNESCVICQDAITQPKSLPCGHIFCKGCIDHYLENYKQICPTCGQVCGIIVGDQPDGTMHVKTRNYMDCAGYEGDGRIDITYSFPTGRQGKEHPKPGALYKGITRTAYLPNNKEGREILDLLEIAFDRKLIFTIGTSRTTGKDDVITWNDIHHKTNARPSEQFGYPDPGYLARVKEELAAKGVTVNDIEQSSAKSGV